jgi:GDP-L-fucose synthase
MERHSRIYVAGHRGLVGSALVRALEAAGFTDIVTRTRRELDLTDQAAVRRFFAEQRPDHVFLAAARVGGIHANNTYPADFIHENIIIQDNVIHQSLACGVKRLLFLGSSCIYPRDCPQPIKEQYLLTGPLEPTNRPYAVAKIAGIETCWAANRQHGTRFLAVMPTNLYGPGDNYDLETSHVLPALIRKFHQAREEGRDRVVVWGSGAPRREFLHVDDLARACIFLMSLPEDGFGRLFSRQAPPLVNIGCGEDLSIRELAGMVQRVVGYEGEIEWDRTRPDGTPRKLLDIGLIRSLGWEPRIPLEEGIAMTYEDFRANISRYITTPKAKGGKP